MAILLYLGCQILVEKYVLNRVLIKIAPMFPHIQIFGLVPMHIWLIFLGSVKILFSLVANNCIDPSSKSFLSVLYLLFGLIFVDNSSRAFPPASSIIGVHNLQLPSGDFCFLESRNHNIFPFQLPFSHPWKGMMHK